MYQLSKDLIQRKRRSEFDQSGFATKSRALDGSQLIAQDSAVGEQQVDAADSSSSSNQQLRKKTFKMSILDLPAEMLVEIATFLGTTGNLANFKMTCTGIYNAIALEKVDRKRLPHLKIQKIEFDDTGSRASKIEVYCQKKHEDLSKWHYMNWDDSNPSSTRFHILTQHWILEDNYKIKFYNLALLSIPLLKSLSEVNYGNAIECEIHRYCIYTSKCQQALPFVHEFLKKVQPVALQIESSAPPLGGALQILKNLKRLEVSDSRLLTHAGLLPHAWKSADLTTAQKQDTIWKLTLGRNIDSNELRTAVVRNQGELLRNPTLLMFHGTMYEIRFKNDVRPEQTLTIEIWAWHW